MSDNALIDSIRSGNEQALAQVYNTYRKEFIGWAIKTYHCPEETAIDAYQNAILVFYDNIMTGKLTHINSKLKTYLFAIGKNKVFESARYAARHALDVKEEILGIDENSGEEKELLEEKYKRVDEGMVKLGEPCKSILILSWYENRSMEYIAKKLGYKNQDVAKNLKHKCMKRLRKIVVIVLP